MGDKLAADHELVGGIVAERIGHAAVPTRHAGPALNGRQQPLFLLAFDLAHRPRRHHEILLGH